MHEEKPRLHVVGISRSIDGEGDAHRHTLLWLAAENARNGETVPRQAESGVADLVEQFLQRREAVAGEQPIGERQGGRDPGLHRLVAGRAGDSRVMRVPSENTSVTGIVRATTCAKRSNASAYGLIEPDTSSSSTIRRGRVALRWYLGRTGSPPAASMWRTVRRGSTRPRRDGRSRKAGRVAGRGRRAAMSSARWARSVA